MMVKLAGINLAMQTPFNVDGSIGFKVFEKLVDDYLEAGVQGLVLGSGTGQHPYLTEDECQRLYKTGVGRIRGRCRVICQTSALNMDEVIRRSQYAESVGADAIMVLPPYIEGPTDDDGLFEFYKEINSSVGIDIVGYNIPQATGISVSVSLLERLGQLDHFKYLKDSGGDFVKHQEYIQTSVNILNGSDPIALYTFMAGAKGAIWGAANYMPKETVELYHLTKKQSFVEALSLWQKMLPSLIFIWNNPYVPCVLRAAQLRGFGTGLVRKPLRALTSAQEEGLRRALAPLFSPRG
jgi:4-hydroxy-tetrahydrodipicolinate synthase